MRATQLDDPKTTEIRFELTRTLLWSGVLSSAWYIAMNFYVPLQDPTYDWMSQTVSELSAIGAPTRPFWIGMGWIYTLLLIGFGLGLWRSKTRIVGGVVILQGVLNPFWPPMHLRPVLAAGGETLSDTLHITFTVIWAALSVTAIALGAASLGRSFRLYSLVSVLLLLGFGFLTGKDAPQMQANLPTPWIGLMERCSIGVFMLWMGAFAVAHLRRIPYRNSL
jgi:hypothetical protein